jgi:transposase InsO family protein
MLDEAGVVKRVVDIRGGEGRRQLIAVPEFGGLRETIMKHFHDSPLSGHLGFDRCLDRIQRHYWWLNMKGSVSNFVSSCRHCATRKVIRHKKGIPLMHQETPGSPMQSIAMDILGPLPVTKRNNRYVIVFTDRFSRFVEVEALVDQETATVAEAFIKCILLRHGAPRVLLSDRGSNFLSSLMKEIYKRLSIDKRQTTSYHPAANGLVERFNSTLLNIISMYVNSTQKNWDELLPFAAFSYNTSRHSTTKLSPFYVLHGRHPTLPIDIIMSRPDSVYNNQHDYTNELCRKLRVAYSTVNEEMKKVMQRYEKLNAKLTSRVSFEVGDKVYKRTVPKPNVNRKLFHPFDGPFIVSEKRNELLYKIHREGDDPSKGEMVNVEKLKPFVERKHSHDVSTEPFTIDNQPDASNLSSQQGENNTTDEFRPLLFSHGDVVWLLSRRSNRNNAPVHKEGPFEVLLKSSRNGKYHIKELSQPKHRLTYRLRDYSNIPTDRLQLCTEAEFKQLQKDL